MKRHIWAIRLRYVNGLKQDPVDYDFEITGSLCFSHAIEIEGRAWGLYLKWGYWACGVAVYKVYLKP